MSVHSVAIVGGGLAGFTVARELRAKGFEGSVCIIDPQGLPYDRPPLSKQYLLGEYDAEKILLAPSSWYAENAVDVIESRALSLDPEAGSVALEDGHSLTADVVVLATGGVPRTLPVPGGDLDTVLTLRTRDDAEALKARIGPGIRAAIIGAGLIGAETASSLKKLGTEVTIIDPLDPPLVPAVGPELARRLHNMHAEHGVEAITGVSASIETDAQGDVHRIRLQDDRVVEAEVVLVGIGIVPETALAESAGIDVDNGILVNSEQRTSHPQIFAVGDCARKRNDDGSLERRAEHWEHAMHTGMTAAAAILGLELPQHGAPWFWSDRYGVHVEGVGAMTGDGRTVIRERAGAAATVFHVADDNTLLGCTSVDDTSSVRAARRIIDRSIPVDPEQLADPDVPLKKLARQRS